MSNKREVEKKEMLDFQDALNSMYKQVDTAKTGIASVLTKDNEVQTYLFGESEAVEVVLMTLIKYAADKDNVNVFEKILNMQTRLMQVHPDLFNEYYLKMQKLKEEGRVE